MAVGSTKKSDDQKDTGGAVADVTLLPFEFSFGNGPKRRGEEWLVVASLLLSTNPRCASLHRLCCMQLGGEPTTDTLCMEGVPRWRGDALQVGGNALCTRSRTAVFNRHETFVRYFSIPARMEASKLSLRSNFPRKRSTSERGTSSKGNSVCYHSVGNSIVRIVSKNVFNIGTTDCYKYKVSMGDTEVEKLEKLCDTMESFIYIGFYLYTL